MTIFYITTLRSIYPMKLGSLLKSINININEEFSELHISGLHFHSKKIKPNQLFVAISGNDVDGHLFINEAIDAGAIAVIGEKNIKETLAVPYICVKDSRLALTKLAKCFYNSLSKSPIIIGVTGTNGKTTTSFMLRHIFEECGIRCSRIGSISHVINGVEFPSENTTPDPLTLHQLLAESEDPVIILEVSSHGLDQGRVDGIEFDFALFTNLSHDHLDYHQTLSNYFEAKYKLFTQLRSNGEAVISHSSTWGNIIKDRLLSNNITVFSVGDENTGGNDVNLRDINVEFSTLFELNEGETNSHVNLPLQGVHNAWNATLSYMAARRVGLDHNKIIQALNSFSGVPGRFEKVIDPNSEAICVVDYAHTPDALIHCFHTLHSLGAKRIFHIFGFRGNGDPSKREEMVQISAKHSKAYILTFDDLNGVPPEKMKNTLEEIQEQFGKPNGTIQTDRTLAIEQILKQATKGDWILITGKGPEQYKQSYFLPTRTDRETIQYIIECK